MFERIKKAFGKAGIHAPLPGALPSGPLSEWAATQGFGVSIDDGRNIALEGQVGGRPWKLVLGRPSRNYIFGEEVRGRAELGIDEDISVVVMNRALKESLEKRAFETYTHDLQTNVDSRLPEEMRWIAMFEEFGWDSLPEAFWMRLAILSDRRESALKWIDPALARLMTEWPAPAPSAEVPFVLLLLNGKAYLRMEYTPPELATLQHAAQIFTSACESALSAFKPPA